jgi:opacity protein-like surface antigen
MALAFVLAAAQTGSAQEDERLGWQGGVEGGITYTNFTGDDVESSDWRIGINAGAFATARFIPLLGVTVGGYFTQKGAENIEGSGVDLRLAYIEIPLVLNVFIEIGEKFSIVPYAGVAFGINVSCSVSTEGAGISCTDTGQTGQGTEDLQEKTEWSIPAGIALGLALAPQHSIFLDARYGYSLTNAFKGDNVDVKNQTVYIDIGYAWATPR